MRTTLWLLPFILCIFILTVNACQTQGYQAEVTTAITESETPSLPQASSTQTRTAPATIEPTETAVPTFTYTPAVAETEIYQATSFPDEYYIEDIKGHRQYFKLGCEASAAVDWAEYFGTAINEYDFQYGMPISDNPNLGFVGNVNDPWGQVPPYSYGVHAEPVAALLREYGLSASAVKDFTLDQLKEQIANGHPVIVWVIGNCVGGVPYQYQDKNGNYVLVAAYEHVIIVTGYNSDTIRYINNGIYYDIPSDVFENSWGVLNNMAVIMDLSTN